MYRETRERADEAALYAKYGQRLVATVRRLVSTSEANVEDACSFAWMQLLRTQPECGAQVFAWLVTVASREAIRLDRRGRRSVALEEVSPEELPEGSSLELAVQVREAMAAVADLPERQREMFTLRLGGYSYQEISQRTGATTRTVDRQLGRARRRLRA